MLEQYIEVKRAKGQLPAVELAESLRTCWGDEPLPSVVAAVEKQAKSPENSLEEEWQRQASKLAGFFAEELGKTKEEYIASLPNFETQPEEWKGRFDIPVIVETRVPLGKMLKKAGIEVYFDTNSVKDWEKNGFETPDTPYATWLNDGKVNLKKSVDAVRRVLKSDERAGTVFDGLALYLRNPEILNDHYLDFPGSQVDSDYAPCFSRWGERPLLNCSFVGNASPGFGSVVAGRKIKA